MLHKSVLCWAGTEKLTRSSVFRWKSFDPSVSPSVPVFSRVRTWRLYPSTSTVWDVVWQKCSLTKESILSGCLSIYLSILSVHPSLLLHAFYFFKPNVLESICEGAEGTPCPAKAQVEYASVPLIHVLYINKIILKSKKEGGDNPSKEDLAVINVACSLFSKS